MARLGGKAKGKLAQDRPGLLSIRLHRAWFVTGVTSGSILPYLVARMGWPTRVLQEGVEESLKLGCQNVE